MRLPSLIVSCLLLARLVAAHAGASEPSATASPAAIAQTLWELQQVQLTDQIGYEVPPAARPLLTQVKHQLRDFIQMTLNSPAHAGVGAADINTALVDDLTRVGVEVGGDHWSSYGYIQAIEIKQPTGHPDRLAAVTTLDIARGTDSSLYVFERKPAGWTLVLAVEANDYDKVRGAQGSFGYALSPPDANGDWFLVAIHISPWCTSMSHMLHYKVLRPGSSPYQPDVLRHEQEMADLNYEPAYDLAAEADGFGLVFGGYSRLHGGSRVYVALHKVAGKQVTRIPPLALLPQDFVDEWVRLPWREAAPWTDSLTANELREWHDRLLGRKESYFSHFFLAQQCGKDNNRWQIGMEIEPDTSHRLPPALYFTVTRKEGAFYLQSIDTMRPPGCPGEALPEEPKLELPQIPR